MKVQQQSKVAKPRRRIGGKNKPAYLAPKITLYSGSDFLRKLGPAQACSPSPGF